MQKDQKIAKLFLNDKEDKAASTGIIDMALTVRIMTNHFNPIKSMKCADQ